MNIYIYIYVCIHVHIHVHIQVLRGAAEEAGGHRPHPDGQMSSERLPRLLLV